MVVDAFEWQERQLVHRARYETLKASSADLPEAVYTTLRTYDRRRVLRLDQHVARLVGSAALKGLAAALDPHEVRSAVRAALDATGHPESRFRLTFAPPRLFLAVEPFVPLPARVYEEGAACLTVPLHRDNPHSKDTRFLATASAAYETLPAGIEEGLMRAEDGSVLEGLSSNFFAVRDGRLWTEEERALLGVTRSLVLGVAAAVLPVELQAVPLDDRVAECFITSVSREVLPVVRVDGLPVGDGRPGPATREIARRFAALVEKEAERL
jgi:branched-chain amino acid aminotransferase